jgi:signal transduction histidine kinase
MDYLQKLIRQTKLSLLGAFLIGDFVLIVIGFVGYQVLKINGYITLVAMVVIGPAIAVGLTLVLTGYLLEPVEALWQMILHLSPGADSVASPNIDKLNFGRELVANLGSHINQLISVANQINDENTNQAKNLSNNFIAQNLPLPLIMLDDTETINFVNPAAAEYIGFKAQELIGKNIYMVLDMSFPSEDTFDKWLKQSKTTTATGSKAWERVRLDVRDNHPMLLFDLAAYYNRSNPDKNETMIILFDHTKQYSQDDQAISFVALSVHELRTPLTLLRGYIEVFEEELSGKLEPEMQSFMEKMQAQADQLMAFVNNILNVARVDDNQLELTLEPEDWSKVLQNAIDNLALRAKVRGITLNTKIAPDLPPVGTDSISIQEVINNLVDNAIKYSGTSKKIDIEAHKTSDGFIETTVQDYGLGVPTSVLPNLFTKFYRDHHNRSQIGGTGLGLYLSKAIVTAHGGNLWVRSKEGEGSTFGFTLQPYERLSSEAKASGDKDMVRGAHGWIKNHSLYRR